MSAFSAEERESISERGRSASEERPSESVCCVFRVRACGDAGAAREGCK